MKSDVPIINLEDDSFGAVLNCAVRYAMSRRTYMPSLVVGVIEPLLPYLSRKTLYTFKQDYEWQANYGEEPYGDPRIDKPLWDKFYYNVCIALNVRGQEVEKALEGLKNDD